MIDPRPVDDRLLEDPGRLLRVPGVANVALWGEHLKQYMVEVDPKRMRAQNVTLEHVMESTSSALDAGLLRFADGHRIGTGGFVDTPNQRLAVEHVLPIVTPSDLAQVVDRESETAGRCSWQTSPTSR